MTARLSSGIAFCIRNVTYSLASPQSKKYCEISPNSAEVTGDISQYPYQQYLHPHEYSLHAFLESDYHINKLN